MYSYGIMLLETFTRTRPSEEIFGEDSSLRSWVQDSLSNAVPEVIDSNILRAEEEHLSEKLQCIKSIMELALNCTLRSPGERMNMKEVLAALTKIKLQLLKSCAGA